MGKRLRRQSHRMQFFNALRSCSANFNSEAISESIKSTFSISTMKNGEAKISRLGCAKRIDEWTAIVELPTKKIGGDSSTRRRIYGCANRPRKRNPYRRNSRPRGERRTRLHRNVPAAALSFSANSQTTNRNRFCHRRKSRRPRMEMIPRIKLRRHQLRMRRVAHHFVEIDHSSKCVRIHAFTACRSASLFAFG